MANVLASGRRVRLKCGAGPSYTTPAFINTDTYWNKKTPREGTNSAYTLTGHWWTLVVAPNAPRS